MLVGALIPRRMIALMLRRMMSLSKKIKRSGNK
jgi:hypothetical protein